MVIVEIIWCKKKATRWKMNKYKQQRAAFSLINLSLTDYKIHRLQILITHAPTYYFMSSYELILFYLFYVDVDTTV